MNFDSIPAVPPNIKDWLEVGASIVAILGIFQIANGLFSQVAVEKAKRVDGSISAVRSEAADLLYSEGMERVNSQDGRAAFEAEVRSLVAILMRAKASAERLRDDVALAEAMHARDKVAATVEAAIARSGAIGDAGSDDEFEGDDVGSDEWADRVRAIVSAMA